MWIVAGRTVVSEELGTTRAGLLAMAANMLAMIVEAVGWDHIPHPHPHVTLSSFT